MLERIREKLMNNRSDFQMEQMFQMNAALQPFVAAGP